MLQTAIASEPVQSFTVTGLSPQLSPLQSTLTPTTANFTVTGTPSQSVPAFTSTELHAPLITPRIDLARFSQKIINLFVHLGFRPPEDETVAVVIKRVLSYAVNEKTTNDEIAEQLGFTAEERAMIMNLKSDAKAGSITNSATGEVYMSQSDFKLAMFTNLGKVNLYNTVSPFINLIVKFFSGGEPDFNDIVKKVINGNSQYFEAILKDILSKHLTGTDAFSSLIRKVIVALERGMDKTLAELQVSQALKPITDSNAPITTPALVA